MAAEQGSEKIATEDGAGHTEGDGNLKGSQTVAAIERAADTLLYLAGSGQPDSGISEISRDLGMSKAAVHRILASLRSRNLVALDDETHRYSLGPAALSIGLAYLDRIDVRRLARPSLVALSESTNETATLSVRAGNMRMYVDQVTPVREVMMTVQLGVAYPLHAGSSSKALLAFLPDDEIEAYLSGPLEKVTASTVVDQDELRAELQSIRSRGWAESLGERQTGAASVAAPILDHQSRPQAVLSVCGPSDRFPSQRDAAVTQLLAAAAQISELLGFGTR